MLGSWVGCHQGGFDDVNVGAPNRGQKVQNEDVVQFSARGAERPDGMLGRELARYDPSGSAYLSAETRVPAPSGGAPVGTITVPGLLGNGGDADLKMNGAHVQAWGRELMALDQSIIKAREKCLAAPDDEKRPYEQELEWLMDRREHAAAHPEQEF